MKLKRIIVDAPGQTCNRLWSYLDTVAWAVVNDTRVDIWFWDPDIRGFNALRHGRYTRFPFYSDYLIRRLGEGNYLTLLFRLLDSRPLHRFYRTKCAERLGLVCGWAHRDDAYFHPRVRSQLLDVFRPNVDICQVVEDLFSIKRKDGIVIIGIHIRRGDYCMFADGRFYFSLDEYAQMMSRMTTLLQQQNPTQQYRFFVSTNERIESDVFREIDWFANQSKATAIHDLYGLSLCDYILGPVSTFSMWAAWYGAKPLAHVDRDSFLLFSLADFRIPSGFFQNTKI